MQGARDPQRDALGVQQVRDGGPRRAPRALGHAVLSAQVSRAGGLLNAQSFAFAFHRPPRSRADSRSLAFDIVRTC